MFSKIALALLAASTIAVAQRPENVSICDYYTTALLKENTAKNQYTLLTLVVNTAVIGNYTQPNVGIAVPGILAPGMFNGTMVNLLPYFTGELESSNRGGMAGVSINFLDGGGAAPLMKNMPANDTTSAQYKLLTHLYSFFGSLLGCSEYGMDNFPMYTGQASMYKVHAFMDLTPAEVGYFITQVALSAASFGVAESDLTPVGMALNNLFGMRCAPEATAIKEQGPALQAICINEACPLAMNAMCSKYGPAVEPKNHTMSGGGMNGTMTMTSGSATMTGPMSTMTSGMMTSPTPVQTAGAAAMAVNVVALAGGFAALML